ncbi:MAG: UDP-2,3-diacylglucosamine diphosphatase LpxI [Alphaproteobacteria bacterium]|nr:UDP-2,3-diacylglucosamine diphosphatase LpxI [Alphaproteobacteria bacterium]
MSKGPKLGIIAGSGPLPAHVIAACRSDQRPFFVLALEDFTDSSLVQDVPHAWIRLGAAGSGIDILKQAGVEELVMVGPVTRPSLRSLRPDARTAKWLSRIGLSALGDDGLLRSIVREVESYGFRFVGVDDILGELVAVEGQYGRLAPDAEAEADIAQGVQVARAIGAMDVGQAVVVQQGLVLGVEAVEGTDALLARCAGLRRSGNGGVLVKLSKPGQERRVDLPTIGPTTIRNAAGAGLRGVAVEAGATLVVDQAELVRDADQLGLFVVGIRVPKGDPV